MKLQQTSTWNSYEAIELQIDNDEVKSWLLENGPITKRIKSKKEFKLQLVQDEVSSVEKIERAFLDYYLNDIQVREVVLFGNEHPMVFARTLIPVQTIQKGFAGLGEIGNKPLGDILFEKNIFTKGETVFASFNYKKELFWGRKTKYTVRGYPFSVMEVFLIDLNAI